MQWLIDPSGALWPEGLHLIARRHVVDDPVEYAVQDLGFIRVRSLNDGLAVSFSPSRVGRAAIAAAFYLIVDLQPKRVALSHIGACPEVEIFSAVGAALHRFEELVQDRAPRWPRHSRNNRGRSTVVRRRTKERRSGERATAASLIQ